MTLFIFRITEDEKDYLKIKFNKMSDSIYEYDQKARERVEGNIDQLLPLLGSRAWLASIRFQLSGVLENLEYGEPIWIPGISPMEIPFLQSLAFPYFGLGQDEFTGTENQALLGMNIMTPERISWKVETMLKQDKFGGEENTWVMLPHMDSRSLAMQVHRLDERLLRNDRGAIFEYHQRIIDLFRGLEVPRP